MCMYVYVHMYVYMCVCIYKYKGIYKLIIEVREFAHQKPMFPLKKLDLTIQFNIYLLSTYYDPTTMDTGMEKRGSSCSLRSL